MKEQEISLETAKLAKLKGFDWECRGYYKPKSRFKDKLQEHFGKFNSNKKQTYIDENGIEQIVEMYSAPTQSLLQKWLRDVHNIFISCNRDWSDGVILGIFYLIDYEDGYIESENYDNYEICSELALLEALNLLNDKS